MTISNDYETFGGSEWKLNINTNDYTPEMKMVEFEDAINQPISWTAKLEGIESSNSDTSRKNNIELKFGGSKVFKGKITERNPNSDLLMDLSGQGMSFDLSRIIYTNTWSNTDIDTVSTEILNQTSNIGEGNISLSASGIDFRMQDESLLEGINRLAGDHGGEWTMVENSGNDEVDLVGEIGGGDSTTTYDESNVENINKNENAGEGDFDGVKVKGYGDGDDQVTATKGSTGSDNEVMVHTDKSIISSSQAQNKADELKKIHVDGKYTEVFVKPGDPNVIRDIGDVVTVKSTDSDLPPHSIVGVDTGSDTVSISGDETDRFFANGRIEINGSTGNDGSYTISSVSYDSNNDETDITVSGTIGDSTADGEVIQNFRIVERYYKVNFEGVVEAELLLNNKPKSFYNRMEETKSESESQTRKMQGNRNTINESNSEISDSNNGTFIELNIPKRYVEDTIGNDRTADVRLDYDVKDYKKLINASDATGINDSTEVVDTTVTDFGNVENVNTERKSKGDADETLAAFTKTDVTNAGGSSEEVSSQSTFSDTSATELSFSSLGSISSGASDETQGGTLYFTVTVNAQFTESNFNVGDRIEVAHDFVVRNTSDAIDIPTSFIPISSSHTIIDTDADGSPEGQTFDTLEFGIEIPEDTNGNSYELRARPSRDLRYENISITLVEYSTHKHQLPDTDKGGDKIQAYTEVKGGGDIDAGKGSFQDNQSLPDTGTITFGQLDSNDLVLTTNSTSATQVRVFVNGSEISNSPFSSLSKTDIDITSDVNTPGSNTIEVRPDSKGFVKANAIVDHKLDVSR